MKVLYLITDLAYGGAETQVVRLATRLKARGWDVRVISMLPPQAYVDELEGAGVPVLSLPMHRGVPDPRALFRMAQILRRERPQVVTSFMIHANLLARLVRPLAWVPLLICSARNVDERGSKSSPRLREMAYRLTDFLCDVTVQNSRAGLEQYVRVGAVPRYKICYIPNGLDTTHFRRDLEARRQLREVMGLGEVFAWLAVGRLEVQKDYPTVVTAFAKAVRDSGARQVLLIAGQGELRELLENLTKKLGIASSVRFLGVRKDISQLMNAADGFVMSSVWEGLANVLLEAAASGLPIVATDVGGNREVVIDSESGFLVPPRDPEALAQAMLRLIDLPEEERRRMGEAGRRHVEAHFNLDRVVDQWEALYQELLVQKRVRVE